MLTMVIAIRERQMNSERIVASVGGEGFPNAETFQKTPSKEFVHLPDDSATMGPQIVKRWSRGVPLSLLVISILFLNGCGLHLHRPEDAKLAQTASTAFKDTKLTEALKAEFDAAAEMLNEEVAAIRRQSNARRDRLISAIILEKETPWKRLKTYADNRLVDLLGPKPDSDWPGLAEWIGSRLSVHNRFDTVRASHQLYDNERAQMKKGPRIARIGARLSKTEESELDESLNRFYKNYLTTLKDYETENKKANTPPSNRGIIGSIASLQKDQEETLHEAAQKAQLAHASLEAVKKKRDEKIAEAKALGKTADEISKALKEAADKTVEAKGFLQDLLTTASDKGLTGVQEQLTALEELRTQISELLPMAADAAAGKQPLPGDSEKIKLLASLTVIRGGIDGAAYPRVSDLILESERLRIEIDRLRGLVALEEERKTFLDLQLTALSREIVALRRATERANYANSTTKPSGLSDKAWDAAKQEAAIDSFLYLAESWSSGRTPAEEIDFLIVGLDHRAALENSSAAFAQWSNLIGVPLSQLVAYHESGIQSRDLANLINAAGLSAIAGGVY